jgi:hypothetical protein
MSWPDVWRDLSARARGYFDDFSVGGRTPSESDAVEGPGELASLVNSIERRYAGRGFPVLGGELEGRMTMSVRRPVSVWPVEGGLEVVRIAGHETAQCSLVVASDGRFGCSWNRRNFVPLFDSLNLLFEDVAVWGSLQGWHFVGHISEADPARYAAAVGGLSPDASARGFLSGWWFGEGIAMFFGRSLTHVDGKPPYVEFLADSAERARSVAAVLAGDLDSTWRLEQGETVPLLQG